MLTYIAILIVVAFLVSALYEQHHINFGAGRHTKEKFRHSKQHHDSFF
jgi:hypothetical protein